MTTFMIDPDNNITAFAHPQEAKAAASGESFASQDALDTLAESWPMDRFVTVWNSFAGVAGFGADLKPVNKFQNRNIAVARIWKALQRLNGNAATEDAPAAEAANTAPRGAKGERVKGKSEKKSTPPKKAPKTRSKTSKPAKTESGAPREDSKKARVIAMLQRKNGATLPQIMEEMSGAGRPGAALRSPDWWRPRTAPDVVRRAINLQRARLGSRESVVSHWPAPHRAEPAAGFSASGAKGGPIPQGAAFRGNVGGLVAQCRLSRAWTDQQLHAGVLLS